MAEVISLVMTSYGPYAYASICMALYTILKCYTRKSSEDRINSFPQFMTEVEGLTVHFVGLFSERKDAVPLLLLHGWPGRFVFYVLGGTGGFVEMCED
jgi:hypothetical protein